MQTGGFRNGPLERMIDGEGVSKNGDEAMWMEREEEWTELGREKTQGPC